MEPQLKTKPCEMTNLKEQLSERERFDRAEEKMVTVLHPKYGNMLLVWKRLWRIMFIPQGRGWEAGDKDDIHKKHLGYQPYTHTETYCTLTKDLMTCYFCTILFCNNLSYSVFNNPQYMRKTWPLLNRAEQK